MDRFTRNYSILLGVVIVVAIFFGIKSAWQPAVWGLDDVLVSDPTLASYPYQFRVRSFKNGVAVISTPRSFDIPAIRFLEIINPKVAGKTQDDPAMIEAQQDLINHQKRAMGLILAQPDVKSVDWELDTQWLADHGVHR
ncbi:hypothetical protein [Thiocystis violacea]|uniref:hypothetical protein n=1 Tax=Thiocystis violacea TaxID=13725 RepID=UPI0019077929|nr:hypothetical protein [Thiocystis violacea]MBK1720672.1 hypothetical protein [Thiocystis violacea]